MLLDSVGDDEVLYRRVPHGVSGVTLDNGRLRPSSQAFADRLWEISVDRALICGGAVYSCSAPTDYVCSLRASQARQINSVIQRRADASILVQHTVIVRPDPILEPPNPAHALIIANPQVANKNTFRKLAEALALLAVWEEHFAPTAPN